jgi:hypothetical protein
LEDEPAANKEKRRAAVERMATALVTAAAEGR